MILFCLLRCPFLFASNVADECAHSAAQKECEAAVEKEYAITQAAYEQWQKDEQQHTREVTFTVRDIYGTSFEMRTKAHWRVGDLVK